MRGAKFRVGEEIKDPTTGRNYRIASMLYEEGTFKYLIPRFRKKMVPEARLLRMLSVPPQIIPKPKFRTGMVVWNQIEGNYARIEEISKEGRSFVYTLSDQIGFTWDEQDLRPLTLHEKGVL